MPAWMAAFVSGLLIAVFAQSYWLIAFITLVVMVFSLYRRSHLGVCLAIVLGMAWGTWQWIDAESHMLAGSEADKTLVTVGTIISIPKQQGEAARFDFKISKPQALVARLYWYQPPKPLVIGSRWQLRLRLKPPHGFANPGSFNYANYLRDHRIGATGYVVRHAHNQLLARAEPGYLIGVWRQKLAEQLHKQFVASPYVGFLQGLTLGITSQITNQQWQRLQQTGTSHLLAISGLHIGLLASIGFIAVNFLWRRSLQLMHWCPAQVAAAIGSLGFALFYAFISGFSIPTQRAVLMVAVLVITRVGRRYPHPWSALAFAGFMVLSWDPLAALSVSFWLSFLAVGSIAYGFIGRWQRPRGWRAWLRVQVYVSLGTAPLIIYAFGQISLVSILANALAIPLVAGVIVPLALLGLVLTILHINLSCAVFTICGALLDLLMRYLDILIQFPFAQVNYTFANIQIFILTCLGVLIALAPRGMPHRYLAIFVFLPLISYTPTKPAIGTARVTVLEVGQGLAVVVETRQHTLIYDTGPRFSNEFDAGAAVVVPFLKTRKIRDIDKVIVSHRDNDHRGGLASLQNAFSIGEILTSALQAIPGENVHACRAGQKWTWDGVEFTMLYPHSSKPVGDNNSSCVLRVSTKGGSILLPGDIEQAAELDLVKHGKSQALASTVIIAPHHGSKTSSSLALLHAVKPEHVVYAVGFHNRFHFPHKLIKQRYQAIPWRTDRDGAITIQITSQETKISAYRQK